jgi:hypothetical protein
MERQQPIKEESIVCPRGQWFIKFTRSFIDPKGWLPNRTPLTSNFSSSSRTAPSITSTLPAVSWYNSSNDWMRLLSQPKFALVGIARGCAQLRLPEDPCNDLPLGGCACHRRNHMPAKLFDLLLYTSILCTQVIGFRQCFSCFSATGFHFSSDLAERQHESLDLTVQVFEIG